MSGLDMNTFKAIRIRPLFLQVEPNFNHVGISSFGETTIDLKFGHNVNIVIIGVVYSELKVHI